MTVKDAVLKVIIAHYPRVKNNILEQAHPKHLMSGLQRMREIRKQAGAVYPFDRETNTYDFSETPIEYFKGLLTNKIDKIYVRAMKNFTKGLF